MRKLKSASVASRLGEKAASLYRLTEASLPFDETSSDLLDSLFEVVAKFESIAGDRLGPIARDVLGLDGVG